MASGRSAPYGITEGRQTCMDRRRVLVRLLGLPRKCQDLPLGMRPYLRLILGRSLLHNTVSLISTTICTAIGMRDWAKSD
jgi:hypothetical protein